LDAEQEADAAATAITDGHRFAVQTRTGVTLARQVPGSPPATSPLSLPAEGVDMPWVGKGTPSSELGYLRDPAYFWSHFQGAYGDRLSPANQTRITNGQAPIVDSTWVRYYPQHAAYLGETLEHPHVGQGSRAVPLPETLHDAYTVFHPQRRVVGTPTGGAQELPPRPTRQHTEAEISRHVTEEHIRGSGITPESPPSAPAVPVSSEVAGLPSGTVTAEGSLGGVRMGKGRVAGELAANLLPVLLVGVARAWLSYEKNVGDPRTEALRSLMEKKVMPAAGRALSEHRRYAEELTAKSPEFPVYANITVDLDLTWDRAESQGKYSEIL